MSANVRSGERCNDGESSQSSWSDARAYAREAEAMQACEYRSGMRRLIRDGEAQRAPCRTAFLSNGSFRPIAVISGLAPDVGASDRAFADETSKPLEVHVEASPG